MLNEVWDRLGQGLTILGCDANARVPLSYGRVSGGRSDGAPDMPGFVFGEFLEHRGWWLPSTFDVCHSGSDATHVHTSGVERRIDYFALSEDLKPATVMTWVNRSFDLLNMQEDHFALMIRICSTRAASGRQEIKCRRERFDLQKLRDAATSDRVKLKLQQLSLPDWSMDVNQHADLLQQQVLAILREELPDAPRSWYLSEAAWALRQRKHCLKQRTRNRRRDQRYTVLSLSFDLLQPLDPADDRRLHFLLRKACLVYELIACAVQLSTAKLRSVIKDEKAAQLARIGQSLGKCHPQDIMSRMRGLQLGRRKVKSWKKQLPGLLQEDGTVTRTRDEVDQLWLRYFGNMEAGTILPMQVFLDQEAAFRPAPDVPMDAHLFPTLTEAEESCRP